MKKILILGISIFLFNCKKSNVTTTNCENKRVRLVDNNTSYIKYKYDASNRILSISSTVGLNYSYTPSTITYNDGGSVINYNLSSVAGLSLATSAVKIFNGVTTNISYNYDGAGYLIQKNETTNGQTLITKYFWTAGNLIKTEGYTPNSAQISTIDYTHDPTIFNTIGSAYSGIQFLGKDNQNAITKAIYSNSNNGTFLTQNFTYLVDDCGCITKETGTGFSANPTERYFSYEHN
jgi:YD repeat-containing protein